MLQKALSKLFAFLGKAQSEDNGNPSTARVAVFYTILVLVGALGFVTIYSCLHAKEYLVALAGIDSALVTTVFGLKVFQKGKEEPLNEFPKK